MELRRFLAGLLLAACLSTGCNVLDGVKPSASSGRAQPPKGQPVDRPATLTEPTAANLKPSVVLVGNYEGGVLKTAGTGFFWAAQNLVATNRHVVTGSDETLDPCKVVINPGSTDARVVEVSSKAITLPRGPKRGQADYDRWDVALLSLTESGPAVVDQAPIDELGEAQTAWLIGIPSAATTKFDGSTLPSPGVQRVELQRVQKLPDGGTVIEFGASGQVASGGPVVDARGRLIGVAQSFPPGKSSGLAIPVHVLSRLREVVGTPDAAMAEFTTPPEEAKPPTPPQASAPAKTTPSAPRDPGPHRNERSSLALARLSYDDLYGLSARELTLMRNEPFARRGYIFSRSELRRHFQQEDWYEPVTKNMAACQRTFNSNENYNVNLIQRFQKENGLQW